MITSDVEKTIIHKNKVETILRGDYFQNHISLIGKVFVLYVCDMHYI